MSNLTDNPDKSAEPGATSTPAKFHVNFLPEYTEEALLEELRRIASLIPIDEPLTKAAYFARRPKAAFSTLQRKFGGWRNALELAGLSHRYSGVIVSEKMKYRPARLLSNADLLEELCRVRDIVGTDWLTEEDFNIHSSTGAHLIRSRFGSFFNGLRSAGISLSPKARPRHSEVECLENLADVWTHYGRAPRRDEMSAPPSQIHHGAYAKRWGSWRKALIAFAEWANNDSSETSSADEILTVEQTTKARRPICVTNEEDKRDVRPALRFKVFRRDNFRCVACGRSPATHLNLELHADHILAVVNGGKTTFENLQTLCKDCNLGKGGTL